MINIIKYFLKKLNFTLPSTEFLIPEFYKLINNIFKLSKLLKNLYNIDISQYDKSFLNNSIERRVNELLFPTIEDYYNYIEQDENEAILLSKSLHNNYSRFFRNSLTFSVLEHIVLPKLIYDNNGIKNKELRIWSSACANGQEVYSLAILLEELKNGDNEKFTYRIFATDHSKSQITKATKGRYTAQNLNNVSLERLTQWFKKSGDEYTVKPILKNNISFSEFDLFEKNLNSPPSSIFGDFDIILCANLLFYYNIKHQNRILKKVNNNIVKDGYIISGESERGILLAQNYKEVFPQSAIFCIES